MTAEESQQDPERARREVFEKALETMSPFEATLMAEALVFFAALGLARLLERLRRDKDDNL